MDWKWVGPFILNLGHEASGVKVSVDIYILNSLPCWEESLKKSMFLLFCMCDFFSIHYVLLLAQF